MMNTDQGGLYIISVAARLLEMHPQTLRKYERAGFLTPNRTGGMLRLYSTEDIQRLQLIKHLVDDLGLNLAGVELGLALARILGNLQHTVENTQDPNELKQRVGDGVQQALDVLGMPRSAQPDGTEARRAPRGSRGGGAPRTTVRITRYVEGLRPHHRERERPSEE